MASRANPWASLRSLSIRTRPFQSTCSEHRAASFIQTVARRGISNDTTATPPPSDNGNGLTSQPPPPPAGFSPYHELFAPNFLDAEAVEAEKRAAAEALVKEDVGEILSFNPNDKVKKLVKLQDRYHPVIHQVTRLLMKDGKLSKAQRDLSRVLNHLRTSPAPKINPTRPLLPGSPPASQLPLNPLLYLTLAIETIAPLVRIQYLKGAAGGGRALELPVPLSARTRRRIAMGWILDSVNKKKSRGSGQGQFAIRVAEEIIAVVEGKSSVWDRRMTLHKLATASRANLNHHAVTGQKFGR